MACSLARSPLCSDSCLSLTNSQLIGPDDGFTHRWADWYKPESADVSKMNLTVKCADRIPGLPKCNMTTSPCLFNVVKDPCEFNNIAKDNPKLVKAMQAKLLDFASR